jgi:hypothetical protein
MAAGKYNILIEQGATFKKVIRLLDQAGTPTNLTGGTVSAFCKARVTDATPLFTFTIVVEDVLDGTFSLNLTKAQTELLNFTTAVYDIEIDIGGIVTRILEGNVVLSRGVTQ